MSCASRRAIGDTRSLDRALQVVAFIIAILMVVLVLRAPTTPKTADSGDSIPVEYVRNPHPEIFQPLAAGRVVPPPPGEQAIFTQPEHVERAEPQATTPAESPAILASPAPVVDEAITRIATAPAAPVLTALTEEVAPQIEIYPDSPIVEEDWQAYEEFPPAGPPAQSSAEQPTAGAVSQAEDAVELRAKFQRLDQHGDPAADGMPWVCVRDNRHDLVWEVKTRGGGLRDAFNVYTWFDPLQQGAAGTRDGGRCAGGIDCDTQGYRNAVNRLGLCGFSDWRLPARQELQTLVEVAADRDTASIDGKFFPATLASWYWSASANERRPDYAWYVLFRNGLPLNDLKSRPKHVRLVRGERLVVASGR